MTTQELKFRLQIIQDELNKRRQEAILLSQNLEQINKTISQLEGNYNECNFWLSQSKDTTELKDEQANNEHPQ